MWYDPIYTAVQNKAWRKAQGCVEDIVAAIANRRILLRDLEPVPPRIFLDIVRVLLTALIRALLVLRQNKLDG